MRTFAPQPKGAQQATSAKLTTPGHPLSGHSSHAHSNLQLPRPIGSPAVQRLRPSHVEEREAGLAPVAAADFGHDFSRIPAVSPSRVQVQTKLKVNAPGDMYEQEADQAAEQVMRMPEPQMQPGKYTKPQMKRPDEAPVSLRAKREGNSASPGTTAPPTVDDALRSPSEPLSDSVRSFFEPRFGRDFRDVRIHTDSAADMAASSVQARAFTVGHHVVFAGSQYQPSSNEGRKLLAHELSHVIQQGGERSLQRDAAMPSLQRQVAPAPVSRPPLQQGTPVRGSCNLRSGAFAWAMVPGTGSVGACFKVQIVFFPGRIDVMRAGTGFLSPSVGARWVPDTRPVALIQTVAAIEQSGGADRPEVDVTPRDTDPHYGARWDSSSGAWVDEATATQEGCSSLPAAEAASGYAGGSRYSRAGSYGAVINDSPMVNRGQRKDFQTTAVVMESAEPLGSLTWSVEHDGTRAVVGAVTCHDQPQGNVPFGTPGHDEMLRNYYQSSPRSVVDGFAPNSSSLPAGAGAVLDNVVQRMTGGSQHMTVVVSGASTSDETDPVTLSRARADSVVSYLTSHGESPSAITVEAYGATAARQPSSTSAAGSANRRVQLTLIS